MLNRKQIVIVASCGVSIIILTFCGCFGALFAFQNYYKSTDEPSTAEIEENIDKINSKLANLESELNTLTLDVDRIRSRTEDAVNLLNNSARDTETMKKEIEEISSKINRFE